MVNISDGFIIVLKAHAKHSITLDVWEMKTGSSIKRTVKTLVNIVQRKLCQILFVLKQDQKMRDIARKKIVRHVGTLTKKQDCASHFITKIADPT